MRKTFHVAIATLVVLFTAISALALVDSSGKYRIELCDGWVGCSDGAEYVGFNNKTCVAGVPPVSKTYGNTVGPLLRGSKTSINWRTWSVDVVSKKADRTIVTIKNDFSQARCTDHYIDSYAEKKDACKDTVWADRVHMHKFPGNWTVKPAKGTDGKCFNIVNHEKAVGCLRYLSANSDCSERHLKLAKKDDGSGLQRWKFVRVGGLTPSPPSLPGSTCVTTGPDNCAGCCKSKFEKFDGSYLDDESCVDVAEYPQCDFLTTPPSPSRSAPKIVSTASGSSTAGKVVFEPEQGATECTVTAIPQGSGPTISATVGHPISFPSTTVNLHNLSPDTVYDIKLTCKGGSGGEQAASNEKELHTTTSDAHPGLINLHPTSTTTAAFHIVRPNPAECDSDTYDVYYSTPGGTARKMTVSSVDVSLGSLSPGTKYEISVDAICKGGSVTKKSAPSFLTTPSRTSPTPPPASPPSPGVPQQPSALKVAPTFHTISVFGPHPEVALFLSGTVPAGSMVQVDVACTDGFTTTVSVPASSPETDVHLPTGLPAGTNCTFTAFTKNGSQQSPSATEIRVVPTATMEAPSLTNWSPDFKRGAGSVVVVAPQSVNCTGGIVKYTVTGTETSPGNSAIIGKRRRSLLQTGFTIAVTTPGTAVVPDDSLFYGRSDSILDMEVVGTCSDGSTTPSGHLSVSLKQCPFIANCDPINNFDQNGKCECDACISGYDLSQGGYACVQRPPSPPPPPLPSPPPPPSSSSFGLAANGVTVLCPNAKVGDTGVVNGVTYTKRDRNGLVLLLASGNEAELATSCTTDVVDMSSIFEYAPGFNLNIGHWDTSKVTNMKVMFWAATSFNQDIGNWDTSKVIDMAGMFSQATAFNKDISNWNTGAVTTMKGMFEGSSGFNNGGAPLSWDTGAVKNMEWMFRAASSFNQDLSGWNVAGVTACGLFYDGSGMAAGSPPNPNFTSCTP